MIELQEYMDISKLCIRGYPQLKIVAIKRHGNMWQKYPFIVEYQNEHGVYKYSVDEHGRSELEGTYEFDIMEV